LTGKPRVNSRWQVKRTLLARALGRLKQRQDPWAPSLKAHEPDQGEGQSPRPIFVVGCQRSGTSLLRRILDSHSRIACPPESQFILPLTEILRGSTASGRHKYLTGLASMGYSRSEVEKSLALFVSSFFDGYAAAQGKRRWADKSPLYVDCLPELWAMFGPHARFVLIIRHGMDVAFSLSDAHRDYPAIRDHVADARGNVAIGAARFWAEQNEKIEKFLTANPDACFQLRYEQLTTDPADSLEPMFAFLGEPWEPDVIDYQRFPHHAGFEDPEVRRRRRIEPNSGRYLAWPADVQAAVKQECEPTLSRLGYR
jgi:sulfotransferase family protein